MAIEIVNDEAALASRAADIVCAVASENPRAVLGLPTGATPIDTYFELGRRWEEHTCDLRECVGFAIDEFEGAERTTPGTNNYFFNQYLRVPLKALHVPDPAAPKPEEHIRSYADAVERAGGFDVCLLGVGSNGHIAFNEPGSERDSRARVVELAPETREAHATTFGSLDAVPLRGMTLGVAEIMTSRAIVVLVAGAHKAEIVARALEGAQTADVPATWLREHADVTWLIDAAAAQGLSTHRASV